MKERIRHESLRFQRIKKRRDKIHRLLFSSHQHIRIYRIDFVRYRHNSDSCCRLYEDYALHCHGNYAHYFFSDRSQLKALDTQAKKENSQSDEIILWFTSEYTADKIDQAIDEEVFDQDLYFKRYDIMTDLILEKFPDLEESFLDHLVEELYAKLFDGNQN